MPPFEESGQNVTATLWEYLGVDKYNDPVVSDEPATLQVRWEEQTRQVRSADGTPVNCDVTVMLSRSVTIHSQMRLGSLPTTGTGTFWPDGILYEVVGYKEVNDFDFGTEVTRVAYLARYKSAH